MACIKARMSTRGRCIILIATQLSSIINKASMTTVGSLYIKTTSWPPRQDGLRVDDS